MIKGLDLMLAEVGKIKIGGKGQERTSQGGGKYRLPTRESEFRVTTLERDANDDFITDEEIMANYPGKCTALDIIFLYDDIDSNFPTRYAYYIGSECKCSGDGEVATRLLKSGETKKVPCNPSTCEFNVAGKCKIGGVLNCLLSKSTRLGGVYKFRTHSFNSVRNILSSLDFIKRLTGGTLSGIPLTLTLAPKHVNVKGKGTTVYIANIEYRGQRNELIENVLIEARRRVELQFDMKKLELQTDKIGTITDVDIKDIVAEFYPENQENYPKQEDKVVEVGGEKVTVINNSQQPEVINQETGEVVSVMAMKKEVPFPKVEPVETLSPEEVAKAEKKARMDQLKKDITDIFDANDVPGADRKLICNDELGVNFVTASRSEDKLLKMKEMMIANYGDARNEDGEEL